MQDKTCCFTGHRDIPSQEIRPIMQRTEKYIWELENKGVKYFGVGGALGYDTLAAKLLFKLRATDLNHIKVILVYPFNGFTNRWTLEQQAVYNELLPQYNKVVCMSNYPSKESYLQRDRHLVDFSEHCIAYCTKLFGGTAYTLRYAKSRGLNILNTAR